MVRWGDMGRAGLRCIVDQPSPAGVVPLLGLAAEVARAAQQCPPHPLANAILTTEALGLAGRFQVKGRVRMTGAAMASGEVQLDGRISLFGQGEDLVGAAREVWAIVGPEAESIARQFWV